MVTHIGEGRGGGGGGVYPHAYVQVRVGYMYMRERGEVATADHRGATGVYIQQRLHRKERLLKIIIIIILFF